MCKRSNWAWLCCPSPHLSLCQAECYQLWSCSCTQSLAVIFSPKTTQVKYINRDSGKGKHEDKKMQATKFTKHSSLIEKKIEIDLKDLRIGFPLYKGNMSFVPMMLEGFLQRKPSFLGIQRTLLLVMALPSVSLY